MLALMADSSPASRMAPPNALMAKMTIQVRGLSFRAQKV